MFRKLKSQLFANQTEKKFLNASIDKTHDFIQLKNLAQLPQLLQNPKSKNELLNFLYKGLTHKSNILVIKCLIVIHYCIRQKFDQQLSELLISSGNDQISKQTVTLKEGQDSNTEAFIKHNVINFYKLYLQKLCTFKQSFQFVKKYIKRNKNSSSKQEFLDDHNQSMLVVCHGFKILNLSHFIFQSQETFNKMGRYYIEYQEIMSAFVQLLLDFNIFNQYINKTVSKIILKYTYHYQSQYKTKKDLKLTEIKLRNDFDKVQQKTSARQNQQAQEMRHYFLYVSQCQKVSDRLYQYYHNRYYYKLIKNVIKFPLFLVLRSKQYKDLMSRTKKVDSKLVYLVKMSKYQKPSSRSLIKIKSETQITSNDHNRTQFYDRSNIQTQSYEHKTEINDYRRPRQIVELTFEEDQQIQQQNYNY